MMILGMLLYRWEVLSSKRSNSYYKKMTLIGLCIGLLISSFGLFKNYENNWSGVYSFNIGGLYTYVSSLLVALGYMGLVMLWAKSDLWKSFKMRLQAVGRMAFTNYIFMSVFCGLIFNGHGLGLFGQLDRLEQLGIVLLNWLIMLFISPIILKRFGQGPLEKLWRKLTYWGT